MSGSGSGPGLVPQDSSETPALMKLHGGGPEGDPVERATSEVSAPTQQREDPQQQRRAHSMSVSQLPDMLNPDDEMDIKLAQKLGIIGVPEEHASAQPEHHGTASIHPTSIHPTSIRTILKHSPVDSSPEMAAVPEGGAAPSPSLPSPLGGILSSPQGSAQSLPGETRRRVSIAVQDDMRTPSAHSHGSHLFRGLSELPKHIEENGKTPAVQEHPVETKKRSFVDYFYNKVYPEQSIESSSWFLFCKRIRKKDEEAAAEAWEPPHWQVVCPYPFCPTYRQFARLTGLTLVVLLLWGSAYAVVGEALAPGGQLFGIAVLTVAAHFGGWLVALATLPALSGMLLVGILAQNLGLFSISNDYVEVVSVLRKIALVIILTRAGLDLDPPALRRLLFSVLKLGLVPWVIECVSVAVIFNLLIGLPWAWGFLLGSVVAAVSPAVTVPCLMRLRAKGYGVTKGIPTLILAISGIDDAASVAGFGIISSIMFSHDSLVFQILQGPLSVVLGLGFGVAWGILAKYVPEKNDPFVVPLRVLMLFGGGLIAVLGSEAVGLGGAGPLAVVAAAFVSSYSWTQQGWSFEENPVATAFEIFWMVFEPILFGLTGSQINLRELDPHILYVVIGCLLIGFAIRIVCTFLLSFRGKFNMKEKVFVSVSLIAKATVQAALAAVPLDMFRESRDQVDMGHAQVFLTTNVMCILLTAPTIAIMMTCLGPRMLTKTQLDPQFPENWRRHTRPSLRDISIFDEDIEDDEEREEKLSRKSSRVSRSSTKEKVSSDKEEDKDRDKEISLTTIS